MRKLIALALCGCLASISACASAGAVAPAPAAAPDRVAAMTDFVQRLPAGTRVRVDMSGGRTVHGTLMRATDTFIEVQERTRIPEPPQQLRIDQLLRVELEQPNNVGRSIAIGVAAGAAGALGFLLILAAIFAGD